jgi:DNA-directed RNA polymerase subunit RPC12/RpoP
MPGCNSRSADNTTCRSFTEGLQLKAKTIICAICGAHARPLEIEVVGIADEPSEIIDVNSWIQCPKCGPRKQPAPSELGQNVTIDYIGPILTTPS